MEFLRTEGRKEGRKAGPIWAGCLDTSHHAKRCTEQTPRHRTASQKRSEYRQTKWIKMEKHSYKKIRIVTFIIHRFISYLHDNMCICITYLYTKQNLVVCVLRRGVTDFEHRSMSNGPCPRCSCAAAVWSKSGGMSLMIPAICSGDA